MPATGAGSASGGVSWMVWVFMESTPSRFRTGSNFVSFFLGAIMAYLAPMELQTKIDELKAEVAKLKALLNGGNPRFGTITCKEWRVIDENDNDRIIAATYADGEAGVAWFDKDAKSRIVAGTTADGNSSVAWVDKDGKAHCCGDFRRWNSGTTHERLKVGRGSGATTARLSQAAPR